MTPAETIAYLKTLALAEALWWFIENHSEASVGYAEVFFYLRDRVRTEQDRMTRAVAELCHFHYELEQGK